MQGGTVGCGQGERQQQRRQDEGEGASQGERGIETKKEDDGQAGPRAERGQVEGAGSEQGAERC